MGWHPAAIFLSLDDSVMVSIAVFFAATLSIALVPAFIAMLVARKRKTGEEEDWIDLLAISCWTLWIALERYLDLQGILHEAGVGIFAAFALSWLLPGLAAIIGCWAAWYPHLVRRSKSAPSTFGQYLREQADRYAGVLYMPFMLSFLGYPTPSDRLPAYLVFLSLAGVLAVFLGRLSHQTLLEPQPLTSGDFYQRVLQLAERAKVKLRAVRIVDQNPGAIPNAYAMWGGNIGISAEYVRDLPPEQLDATLVHELAHVRYYDLLRPLFAGVLFFAAVNPALKWLMARVVHPAWHVVPQSVVLLLGLALIFRRSEYRADALASDLTNPEAEVRSLFAIHRIGQAATLTQHPILEVASVHPSLMNRVKAIALRHGRSSEWLRTILHEEWHQPLERDLRALTAIHLPTTIAAKTLL